MKKQNRNNQIRIQKKRERKNLKRKGKTYNGNKVVSHAYTTLNKPEEYFENIIEGSKSTTYTHFFNNGFYNKKYFNDVVIVPKVFSFHTNYDKSLDCIKRVFSSIYEFKFFQKDQQFILSFEKCEKVETSALLLLHTIVLDYFKYAKKISTKLGLNFNYKNIILKISNNDNVNNILQAVGFPGHGFVNTTASIPVYSLKVIIGNRKKKKHNEQSKLTISIKVRNFINTCLSRNGFSLSKQGINAFDNMIGEILNNAEDHSDIDDWFLTGNLFEYKNPSETEGTIGELNLVFLNLGHSIYEGFEESKKINEDNYSEMESLYNRFLEKNYTFKSSAPFSKENLMSLYALQEGYSRLHYEDEGRGTGTMTFIRAFFEIGNYENQKLSIIPRLSIYSGYTNICITNKHPPFLRDNIYFLSLNKEENLIAPPSKDHLRELNNRFPGTMLSVKMYINKNHILSKINKNNNEN